MKVTYYLNEGRIKNLYCRISNGTERVSFSLAHTIDPKLWNAKKEEGPHGDPYHYTLSNFKEYLSKRFHQLKSESQENILNILKNEAEQFIDGSGIEGIARKMFDDENGKDDVPSYDQFIQAFQMYSSLKKDEFIVMAVDNLIHIKTKNDDVFEMDTYPGLRARLKDFVDRNSLDEIRDMTDMSIWGEIYIDGGIEKHVFVPVLLRIWEKYWNKQYQKIEKSVGKTNHLDPIKAESWRQFQVFMECYDSAVDVIELADNIDEMELSSMAVMAMLQIFNAEACYEEYCESELDGKPEWESISINNEDDDAPIFHIKEADDDFFNL